MTSNASIAKGYRGWGMEGMVAKWYAGLTKKSLDEFKTLARRVAEQIEPGRQRTRSRAWARLLRR